MIPSLHRVLAILIAVATLLPCSRANGPEGPDGNIKPAKATSLYAFNARSVNVINDNGLLDVTEGHFGHLAYVPCGDCPGMVPKVVKSKEELARYRRGAVVVGNSSIPTELVTCGGTAVSILIGISAWICDPNGYTEDAMCSSNATCTDHTGCSSGGDCTQGTECSSGGVCTSGTGCSTGWDCTFGGGGCSEGAQCTQGAGCSTGRDCTYSDACSSSNACTNVNNCSDGSDCTLGDACSSGDNCTNAGECSTGSDCTIGENCSSGSTCTGGPDCSEVEDCTEGSNCSTGDQCTAGGQCSDHDDCTSEGMCTDGANCSQGDECTANSGCSYQDSNCSDATGCTDSAGCSAANTSCYPKAQVAIGVSGGEFGTPVNLAMIERNLDRLGRKNGIRDLSSLLLLSALGLGLAAGFTAVTRV